MIAQANVDYLWNTVVNPRLGNATHVADAYVWGGSFSGTDVNQGTDCSGAVSAELCALMYGPSGMIWARQFWTGTFAGATPGQGGPFGGVACTSAMVCIASPSDAPADAAMVIAVYQNADASVAHMICEVGGVTIEMGGDSNNYHTNLTDPNCSRIDDTSEFNQWFYVPGPIGNQVQGVDYSGGLPGGAAIKAAGYSFACRYVMDGSPSLPYKLLTAAEANDLQANGVGIVSNWESTANAALGGFDQGAADAQAANANHLAAGGPATRPIYFSVDYDAAETDQPAINAYFQGVASVIGLDRTGAYGGYWVISRLFDAGLITWGWQTEAWSADPGGLAPLGPDSDYLDARANILQRNAAGFVTINGVQCDVNESQTDDFGQWNYTGETEMTPDQAAQLAQIWGALFNLVESKSPLRAPGGSANPENMVATKDFIWNDDGFDHPEFVEWAANHGDAESLALLNSVANLPATDPEYAERQSDIALAKSILASLNSPAVVTPNVAPAPVPVTPAPTTDPLMNVTVAQLLQWGKDGVAVIGALLTYVTAAHNLLGQYLPGATGVAVPAALAVTTTGLGAHAVHQKRVAQKALTMKGN